MKKKKMKKNTILCSVQVCPRTRGLLAKAAPAVHHLFDDLSTSSGLSTKTKRFGYFALVLSQERVLFLTAHEEMKGVTYCDKC